MPTLDNPVIDKEPDEEDNYTTAHDALVELLAVPIMTKHPKLNLYNTQMDQNAIANIIESGLDDPSDKVRQQVLDTVMSNTFSDYPKDIARPSIDKAYVYAATKRAGLPLPSASKKRRVTYTADDAIIGAQSFINTGNTDEFVAGIGHAFSPDVLGVIIEDRKAFTAFKADLMLYASIHTKSSQVQNMFNQFNSIDLDNQTLTQSLLLRKDHSDTFDADSFATILLSFIHEVANDPNNTSVQLAPLSLYELISTKSIVFINALTHSTSNVKEVDREWLLINKSTAHPFNVVNFNKITKLTTAVTNMQKMAAAAANASGPKQSAERRAKVKFLSKRPKTRNITGQVEKIILKMGSVNRSQNITTISRRTPLKVSRRNSMNPNAFGVVQKQIYLPDLHIFLDQSGSITLEDQKNMIIMMISMAKKLNIDFYFSSFSHVLSPEVLIPTKGKSPNQIWNYLMQIPKVGGGTDFRQISDYINADPERQARMNLVITDFGWTHYGSQFRHAKNLWYAPCSMENWAALISMAKGFISSMDAIEPKARTISRCIGLF